MDAKGAIAAAKAHVGDLYADEGITNLGLEEVERAPEAEGWRVTLAFSRPWNTPRTRAQEVLENLGGMSALKRSYKVVTIDDEGAIRSMKSRQRSDTSE